jgi:hypothetical protein
VRSLEYVGQGNTDQFLVRVRFEVHPRLQKDWRFRHQELEIMPSATLAAPFREEFNL